MKNVLFPTIFVLAASGCSRGADAVVKDYRNQERCEDRLKFVAEPEAYRAQFLEYYKDLRTCVVKTVSADATDCKGLKIGDYCTVTVDEGEKTKSSYCVVQTTDGPKIDWPCSVVYNPISVKSIKATMRVAPAVVRVTVALDDGSFLGLSESESKKFHRLRLWDSESNYSSFVPKSSAEGSKLFELVKDGKRHAATLGVAAGTEFEVRVTHFIQPSWRMTVADQRGLDAPVSKAAGGPAAPASAGFSLGSVTGKAEDCKALTACCTADKRPPAVDVYCDSIPLGMANPDCTRNLESVHKLHKAFGEPPAGCVPPSK